MSKYDQYIKEFLLKNSELSIERIGVLNIPPTETAEKTIQPQFITFRFDKKAQTSPALINYISAETSKNKVLISSDLTSLFEDARQYANLGKAFSIAGLGDISLNRQGEFLFTPASSNVTVAENNYTPVADTESPVKKQAGRNAIIFAAFLIVALVAGGLGWGIYKYFTQKKPETAASPLPEIKDTTQQKQETVPAQNSGAPAVPISANNDTTEYKFIFETTFNTERAYKRYNDLIIMQEKCFLDSMPSGGAVQYSLYVKIKSLPKDTTYLKDSVQKYFARPNAIIIKHN